jgi:phosphoribosylformimino-5-aminoimidazole carboxamide ribotide isomerase
VKIVPVIDLRDGQVVHARGGNRAAYRPLQSELCASTEPPAVVRALRQFYPFTTLYVADLDALEHRSSNVSVIRDLLEGFPDLRIWLDAGIPEIHAGLENPRLVPVIGSETGIAPQEFIAIRERNRAAILSLDYGRDGLLGRAEWLAVPESWPETVIAMTLARTGSEAGPDLDRVRGILALAGDRRVYAAGGVRHDQDLRDLEALGAHGALLATALHRRCVDPARYNPR